MNKKLGESKFILVHHSACQSSAYHYRITASGDRITTATETDKVQHAKSIEIVLEGSFENTAPSSNQIDALKNLVLEIKQRYPNISVGGHRQVRGDNTICPGRKFPLNALLSWSKTGLIAARDAAIETDVERQYRP
jgi:N-acetyl-anhydromuramyl-L-alanine amidase AmpD